MTKKPSELTRTAILADLRSGKSKRSISRDLAVTYYQVNRLSEEISGAELGGEEKLAPQDAPSPSESDVAEQGHPPASTWRSKGSQAGARDWRAGLLCEGD